MPNTNDYDYKLSITSNKSESPTISKIALLTGQCELLNLQLFVLTCH